MAHGRARSDGLGRLISQHRRRHGRGAERRCGDGRLYAVGPRTWLAFANARNLRILVEGGPDLVNRYDVILLPPGQRPPGSEAAAHRLADWLASSEGQTAIGGYKVAGQQLFHPSASAAPF